MGPGQAMLGRVQKKVACVQLDTLEFEIQARRLQYVKNLCLEFMGVWHLSSTFSISVVAEIRKWVKHLRRVCRLRKHVDVLLEKTHI